MSKEFGERISAIAKDLGLSQRKIGEQPGLSRSKVSRMTNGKRDATPQEAMILKTILRVPQDHLEEFLLLSRGFSSDEIKAATGREISKMRKTHILRRSTGEAYGKITY